MATKSRAYKDITLDFQPNPVTGDLNVLKNERAIMRSIRNLVQTGNQERFYSDIGSDVGDLLFDFCDEVTGGVLARKVKSVIEMYEPRVTETEITANPRPDLNNSFQMTISYKIVGEDLPIQNFAFLLEGTR